MSNDSEDDKEESVAAEATVVMTETEVGEEFKLNTSLQPNDIVFDCPHCGKSLAIDGEGAGMAITCPDCQNVIQVPYPDALAAETAADATQMQLLHEQLAAAQNRVAELTADLNVATLKIEHLEKSQSDLKTHLEQMSTEWGVIQNALDRVMALMQEIRLR
jgi:predicted  nucleic acid-binding Zn-ribbon protein